MAVLGKKNTMAHMCIQLQEDAMTVNNGFLRG